MLECLLKAAQCEQMAGDCVLASDRRVLRETARHWHTLAKVAHITRLETEPAADTSG